MGICWDISRQSTFLSQVSFTVAKPFCAAFQRQALDKLPSLLKGAEFTEEIGYRTRTQPVPHTYPAFVLVGFLRICGNIIRQVSFLRQFSSGVISPFGPIY